jgi:hypothetical protein
LAVQEKMIVRHNSGLGDVCAGGPGDPWSWQRTMFTLAMCNNPVSVLPPMVAPPAPTIALTSAPKSADSVYAGQAGGAAVYATPSTAAENMQAVKDNILRFYSTIDTGTPPGPSDCTGFFSFLNPLCPSLTTGQWLLLAGGAIGLYILFVGGRR